MNEGGRLLLVCGTLFVLLEIARGAGAYQNTRDGKAIVWNNNPKPGDEATWSGGRDREGYARGFGRLIWYTKEPDFAKAQLFARYWGRMVDGKFEGQVNVHSKRKTHYAIFVDGARVTRWAPGNAPSRAAAQWRAIAATKKRAAPEPASAEELRRGEPEAPAQGPSGPDISSQSTRFISSPQESIRDLTRERWPTIDIDDSLRALALPPRSLRARREEE